MTIAHRCSALSTEKKIKKKITAEKQKKSETLRQTPKATQNTSNSKKNPTHPNIIPTGPLLSRAIYPSVQNHQIQLPRQVGLLTIISVGD
jgi:hypothetical protein